MQVLLVKDRGEQNTNLSTEGLIFFLNFMTLLSIQTHWEEDS